MSNERTIRFVPIGIDAYDKCSGFDSLPGVLNDILTLERLFTTERFAEQGFVVDTERITGTAGQITDRLQDVKRATLNGQGLVVLWSGHGEYVVGDGLRLATAKDQSGNLEGSGMAPDELVKTLVASGCTRLVLILDVCQAGDAMKDVASALASSWNASIGPDDQVGFFAYYSASATAKAIDSGLIDMVDQLLRRGPSPEAEAFFETQGFGRWSPQDRVVSCSLLAQALEAEATVRRQAGENIPIPVGTALFADPGLFPNPLYATEVAACLVSDAVASSMNRADATTHFLPKARGLDPGEWGWSFSGRVDINTTLVEWVEGRGKLATEPVLVLTGEAGTGKSAILGRLAALSDPNYRDQATANGWDEAKEAAGTVPDPKTINAAVHLRGRDVEGAIAALAEILAPDQLIAGVNDLVASLDDNAGPTVILDALDEALNAEAVVAEVVLPLRQKGWRLLVGTRPHRDGLDLLATLGGHSLELENDLSARLDIADYVRTSLRTTRDSPYEEHAASDEELVQVAEAIAEHASGSFLYARLTAGALARRAKPLDRRDGWEAELANDAGAAFDAEIARIDESFAYRFPGAAGTARGLLKALAYGRGRGLPLWHDVWPRIATVVTDGTAYDREQAEWVLRRAGRFIVEDGEFDQAVYRLFHDSLDTHLRKGEDRAYRELSIFDELDADAKGHGGAGRDRWAEANPYAVRYALEHLTLAGERGANPGPVHRLVTDPGWLHRAVVLIGGVELVEVVATSRRRIAAFYDLAESGVGLALQAIEGSLRRSRAALAYDPCLLGPMLHARLGREPDETISQLGRRVAAVANRPWLRMIDGRLGWRADLATMYSTGGKVRALAFGELDGVATVAIGIDDRIELWDPRRPTPDESRAVRLDGRRPTALAFGEHQAEPVLVVACAYDSRVDLLALDGRQVVGPIELDEYVDTIALGSCGGVEPAVAWSGNHRHGVFRLADGAALGLPDLPDGSRVLGVSAVDGELVVHLNNNHVVWTELSTVRLGDGITVWTSSAGPEETSGIQRMRVSPVAGGYTVVATDGNRLLIWDAGQTWVKLRGQSIDSTPIRDFAAGEIDGRLIALESPDYDSTAVITVREPQDEESTPNSDPADNDPLRVLGATRLTFGERYSRPGVPTMRDVFSRLHVPESEWQTWSAPIRDLGLAMHRVAVTEEGPMILAVTNTGHLQVWDASRLPFEPVSDLVAGPRPGRQTQRATVERPTKTTDSTAIVDVDLYRSPARGDIVAMAVGGSVRVVTMIDGESIDLDDEAIGRVQAVSIGQHQDRLVIVTGSVGGRLIVTDPDTGEMLAQFRLDEPIRSVAIDGDSVIRTLSGVVRHAFELDIPVLDR